MRTRDYDLIVLGAGSGRNVLGPETAHLRRALIDPGPFGGTCLNRGCIPTKMLLHAAELAGQARESAPFGVDAHVDAVRWNDIQRRVFGRLDPYAAGGPDGARRDGIDVYRTAAHFTGERTMTSADDDGPVSLRATEVVIATGAAAVVPPAIAESGVRFHTSDTIMRIDRIPEHLLVLGGGVVGLELAQLFSDLGSRITVVTRGGLFSRHVGAEMTDRFTTLIQQRWETHLHATVADAAQDGDRIRVTLSDGTHLTGDELLVSVGRRPSTDHLGLDAAGVRVEPGTGRILTDEFGRTSAQGVWALGDVSARQQLKHLANEQARTVTHNLLHPDALIPLRDKAIPAAMFTRPQLAWVGETPESAQASGRAVVTYSQDLSDTAYGWALEDTTSLCTVVAEASTGVVLGAQIMAPMASSLIQPLIDAVTRGLTARDAATTSMWIHPAASEVVENALLGAAAAAGT